MSSVDRMKMRQGSGRKAKTGLFSHHHTVGGLIHLSSLPHSSFEHGCPGNARRLVCLTAKSLGSGNTSQSQPAALHPRVPSWWMDRLFRIQRAGVQTKFVLGRRSLAKLVSGPMLIKPQLGSGLENGMRTWAEPTRLYSRVVLSIALIGPYRLDVHSLHARRKG